MEPSALASRADRLEAATLGAIGPAAGAAAPAILDVVRGPGIGVRPTRSHRWLTSCAGLPPWTAGEDQALAILVEFFKLEPNSLFTREFLVAMARFGSRASAALSAPREIVESGSSAIGEAAGKAVAAIERSVP